ncbi:MAG: RNA methyltransferase [Sphingomonadales bacterium]|nr:RNA methyltransferase [Sphingomonadales bacterium]
MTHASKPVIVLVEPQLGENIGKVARAMLNFGLEELRLVAPRDGWPNPAAVPTAAGATSVLDKAKICESVSEAVADCGHVYATTVRPRGMPKPVLTPAAACAEIAESEARSAILFGPERSGLDAEAVALARAIVTVPVNPEFGSLNLAQAVVLLAYEYSRAAAIAHSPESPAIAPAPQAELDGLIAHLFAALDGTGYFFPPDRTPSTKRTLRSILTKPGWSSAEIQALRGVFAALRRKA